MPNTRIDLPRRPGLLPTLLLAAGLAGGPALAAPIHDPGGQVNISSCLRGLCNNTLVFDRGLAQAEVATPQDLAAGPGLPPPGGASSGSRGRVNLAEGTLKADVALPRIPFRNSYGSAEVSLLEVVTLGLPAGGVGPADTLALRFLVDGEILNPSQLSPFYLALGFWLRDASLPRFDPALPDTPTPHLLTYQATVQRALFPSGLRDFVSHTAGVPGTSVQLVDNGVRESGVGTPRLELGIVAEIPVAALLDLVGPARSLEFAASLYLFAEVPSEIAAGVGPIRLNFMETARITASLPPGYSLDSPSGFLSQAGAEPSAVPAPAGASLLLAGLAALAFARRR